MKKVKIISIAILIFVLSYALTTYAQSSISRGYVGGKIISLKAYEVATYEDAGFICDVPGTSIEITPVRGQSETSFLVSEIAKKWTPKYNLRTGQWILSKQQGSTTINCRKCDLESTGFLGLGGKEETCFKTSFDLPTITHYGTSR